jgi:hypothetical protein
MNNLSLRATVLLAGHGVVFTQLFSGIFALDLLDSANLNEPSEFRRVFVVAVFSALAAFGMFAAYRALEKSDDNESAARFWLRRSLNMMFGILISLVAIHWFYGWRYVAIMGFERAFLP